MANHSLSDDSYIYLSNYAPVCEFVSIGGRVVRLPPGSKMVISDDNGSRIAQGTSLSYNSLSVALVEIAQPCIAKVHPIDKFDARFFFGIKINETFKKTQKKEEGAFSKLWKSLFRKQPKNLSKKEKRDEKMSAFQNLTLSSSSKVVKSGIKLERAQ